MNNEIQNINFQNVATSNDYVDFVVTDVSTSDKYVPNIKVNVINKTNKIINVFISESFFISKDRIQYDIKVWDFSCDLEILPNVGKKTVYNFRSLSEKDYIFNENDLIITSFVVNNEKHVVGFRVGNAANKNNLETKNIPIKQKPRLSGCSLAFVIVAVTFMIMFIVFGILGTIKNS